MDIDELQAGNFAEALEDAISKSEVFLLLLTQTCFRGIVNETDYVRMELDAAIRLGKPIFVVSLSDDKIIKKLEKSDSAIHKQLLRMNIMEYVPQYRNALFSRLFDTIKASRTARTKDAIIGRVNIPKAAVTGIIQGAVETGKGLSGLFAKTAKVKAQMKELGD